MLTASVVAAASAMALFAATPAEASSGRVTVFTTEVTPLKVYDDPSGCNALPPGAHVLTDETDSPVRVYADPFCLTPSLVVQPGYGTHVPPLAGSFSVDD